MSFGTMQILEILCGVTHELWYYVDIRNTLSGLSSSLLMKTSCLRLKLVELNFFASFNADDQSKTYVSNVSNK